MKTFFEISMGNIKLNKNWNSEKREKKEIKWKKKVLLEKLIKR